MMDTGKKPILCLDFDGVIHSYTSGWLGADVLIDPPVPGALEALVEYSKYFDVQIYSSRSNSPDGCHAMKKWLKAHMTAQGTKLPPDCIKAGSLDYGMFVFGVLKWPTSKPPAMITIDDRAVTFTGEWPTTKTLQAFKPWNKK